MQDNYPEHIKSILDVSKNILGELKKDRPSADRVAELYQSRMPHLQQLQGILESNAYSNKDVLPGLNQVVSLDSQIMSHLNELKQEKEQELKKVNQEQGTVASYRETDERPKSFFIKQKMNG